MTADRGNFLLRLFREGRRRRVYTSAVAYIAVSVVLVELGGALFDALRLEAGASILTILLLLGFPLVLVLAWIFDVGATGIHRTSAADADAGAAGSTPAATLPIAATAAAAPTATAPTAHAAGTSPLEPPRARRPPPPPPERVAAAVPDATVQAPDPQRVQRAALAHVRHELKTPINAIIGYSEMLLEDAVPDTAAAADLRRIRQAGHQLLLRVEEILDPDRIDTQPDALDAYSERVRADLRDPITAVIGYCEMLLDGTSGTSGTSGSAAAGERGAANESGAIDERAAADLERIRGAAVRLLDLSTDIVQVATGADNSVQLGRVSEMTESVLSKLRPLELGAGDDRQGVLLVVDDNPLNRDLLSRQLARRGYEVATADSGAAALQLLEEQSFDLVLLDILMPGIDGVEVLRRIRAQPRLAAMPVMMTSSLDEIDSVIRCLEIGAADYVTKPFDPTLLDARISACLQLRRLKERESYFREQLADRDAVIERVLLGALPPAVAGRVRTGDAFMVDAGEASVLYCDLERLLRGDARSDSAEAAARMRFVVHTLQQAAAASAIEVVTLHGSGLLLAAGLPTPCDDHAVRVAAGALAVVTALRAQGLTTIRFGMHTGVAAGTLLGEQRLVYHLWGDAVDLARRLEHHADAGTVHVSPAAHAALRDRFSFGARGVLDVAGRQMRTYTLDAPAVELTV
jgi:adenylate cyclase